jgi:hypothetical protein
MVIRLSNNFTESGNFTVNPMPERAAGRTGRKINMKTLSYKILAGKADLGTEFAY